MDTRGISRSFDHVNWWDPQKWKSRRPRSLSSTSLGDTESGEIRNGWLTLHEPEARFQQKQMQEREMKIASLYEAQQARALDRVRHSPSNVGTVPSPPSQQTPVAHQHGKVRQMFEERRTKAGIDKSYPLQPIHNTDKPAARKPLPNGYSKVTTGSKVSLERKTSKTHTLITSHSVKKHHNKTDNMINGSGDLNHNHELDLNNDKQKLPHSNGEIIQPISTDELDKAENNYLIENETFPEALAPTPTPRSPVPAVEVKKPPPRRSPAQRASPARSNTKLTTATPPNRKNNNENTAAENNKARGAMQRGGQTVLNKRQPVQSANSSGPATTVQSPRRLNGSGSAAGSAGAGEPCGVCGRRFAPDRLDKHQEICKKSHAKKRKPFDVLKHRLAGTDAEGYKGTEAEPFISKLRKPATNNSSTSKVKSLNNNWRKKHEEFIQAIRAAKQVQAHLNAGGKLSDLPPPPPSENPDYVSCPHCNRRFNQAAAERHVPKCANYQFNKPKPAAKRR